MSTRKQIRFTFLSIIIIALMSGYIASPEKGVLGEEVNRLGLGVINDYDFHLGLDLQGGTHLVYQADLSQIESKNKDSAMEGVKDVIERRVNAFGVSEPIIQIAENDRLVVELAGVKDVNQAINMIGETPYLEFKEEMIEEEKNETRKQFKEMFPDQEIPPEFLEQFFYKSTDLSGKQLSRAAVAFDPNTYQPEVQLEFDGEGRKLFKEITERNVGRKVAIFLDGAPISIPVVNEPIVDGKAIISGSFTLDEAKILAQRLNAGALPVPIKLLSQQTVGASLGEESLQKSLKAGIAGLIILSLLMILYYRLPGLLAVAALLSYSLIILALFKLIPITLTLSGIAGFILSIGIAVDANVLIFERMKEELKKGRTLTMAIEEGFARAWTSIRDSNVSTLITCFVLAYFSTSIVKGFAITLGIGILISMFSAIVITKTFLNIAALTRIGNVVWLFGASKKKEKN